MQLKEKYRPNTRYIPIPKKNIYSAILLFISCYIFEKDAREPHRKILYCLNGQPTFHKIIPASQLLSAAASQPMLPYAFLIYFSGGNGYAGRLSAMQ